MLRILLVFLFTLESFAYGLQTKLTASDRAPNSAYGYSIATSGSFAIVGAFQDDALLNDAGAVYILERNINGAWQESTKLYPTLSLNGHLFGQFVAISGDHAAVSTPTPGLVGNTIFNGIVTLFKRDPLLNSWIENQVITPSATQRFGNVSVSLDGDTLLIGTPGSSTYGAAYIYTYNAGTEQWGQSAELTPNDGDGAPSFGFNVSISGDYAFVGVPNSSKDELGNNSLRSAGAVYIYKKQSDGSWLQLKKVISPNPVQDGFYGFSVFVNGDYAIIGAPFEGTNQEGAAYILRKNSNDIWESALPGYTLTRSGSKSFGHSVSIDALGGVAIVGAPEETYVINNSTQPKVGAAYRFGRDSNGGWEFKQKILPLFNDREKNASFGRSLALNGTSVFVGAPGEKNSMNSNTPLMNYAGAVYIFGENTPVDVSNPHEKVLDLTLHPNPTSGPVSVEMKEQSFKHLTVEIVSISEGVVSKKMLFPHQLSFDISELSQATYFARVVDDKRHQATRKIIKN